MSSRSDEQNRKKENPRIQDRVGKGQELCAGVFVKLY